MESVGSDEKRNRLARERLVLSLGRAVMLAPGGFVAGYLSGLAAGRVISGCAVFAPCDQLFPALLALALAIVGMGCGCALGASRVGYWWEGVAVWGTGILSMLLLVLLVGWLGRDSLAGRAVAIGWLAGAVVLSVRALARPACESRGVVDRNDD